MVPEGSDLERFRTYLRIIAKSGLHSRLRAKVDPSDIVQQALLHAFRARDQFQGTSSGDLAAWLRKIAVHDLDKVHRHYRCERRSVRREVPLAPVSVSGDSSSGGGPEPHCAAEPPLEEILRRESASRLKRVLADLPRAERLVIVLHHCRGLTLGAVAGRMRRSRASVAGLLRRGLLRLRGKLREPGSGIR